jgi:hypothetical protein
MYFEIEMYGLSKTQLPTRESLDKIDSDDELITLLCRHMWSSLKDEELDSFGHVSKVSPGAKAILIDAMMKLQPLISDEWL